MPTTAIGEQEIYYSALIPACSIHLASESGHRYGDEHPWLRTASDSFRKIADIFLARLAPPALAAPGPTQNT